MKTIGILITGHVREELVGKYGEYGRFFEAFLGRDAFHYHHYFAVDGDLPEEVDACDGYLITGSAHGAYEDLPFIKPLEAFVRTAYQRLIPLVGICFGHQIMAQALGGKVEKFNQGWALGGHEYLMDLGAGHEEIRLHAVHQDQVIAVPAEAEVIGSSPFCANAALNYKGKAISFQPHPEFEAAFVHDLVEVRRGLTFDDALADAALASLNKPVDNRRLADYIRQFFCA